MLGIDPDAFREPDHEQHAPLIWPDMVDPVALFMAMSTQWDWIGAGMAGAFRSGLKYASLAPVAAGLGIALIPSVFTDIRLMEIEALDCWNKRNA